MTSYRATSQDGRSYSTTTVTDDETKAYGNMLEKFFGEGVERYGSVDAFADALGWYNTLAAATR